jgi:hypothetical protein
VSLDRVSKNHERTAAMWAAANPLDFKSTQEANANTETVWGCLLAFLRLDLAALDRSPYGLTAVSFLTVPKIAAPRARAGVRMRNRYKCATELGLSYPRIEYSGTDPLGFVVSHNLHRRHMTESQRAMVAAKMANMPEGRNWDNSANLQSKGCSVKDSP